MVNSVVLVLYVSLARTSYLRMTLPKASVLSLNIIQSAPSPVNTDSRSGTLESSLIEKEEPPDLNESLSPDKSSMTKDGLLVTVTVWTAEPENTLNWVDRISFELLGSTSIFKVSPLFPLSFNGLAQSQSPETLQSESEVTTISYTPPSGSAATSLVDSCTESVFASSISAQAPSASAAAANADNIFFILLSYALYQ